MFLVKIALVLGHISVNQRKKVDMLLILDHLLVIVMLEIIFVQVKLLMQYQVQGLIVLVVDQV